MAKHVRVVMLNGAIETMVAAPEGVARYAARENIYERLGDTPEAAEQLASIEIVPLSQLEKTKHGRALIDAYLESCKPE